MHRVVIVGCGFAGLFAAKALRRAPVEVVVVDPANHHLFQPLLYQVATGVLSEGDVAPPIRDILRHQRNTRVVLGEVVDVDVDERRLRIDTLGRESELSYDSLIVATGAAQSYFGHDEYAVDAPGMKTIDDALELRGRIFGAFEMAELSRRRARRDLERLGVEVRLRARVVGVDATGLDLEGDRIEARTRIWAAGVQAAPLGRMVAERAGAAVDRSGRVEVQPDCSLAGHPEVFVVGDLMALDSLPGLAEVAMQSGHHAARTIVRGLRGQPAERFRYRDLGTMATISRFRAVVSIGRLQFGGFVGWLMWLVVHLAFLTGFKNRVSALANWAVAFLGRGRRQRTITKQQTLARTEVIRENALLTTGSNR